MEQFLIGKGLVTSLVLIVVGMAGCAVPNAVDPLPYYSIDGRDGEIVSTRELCRLYSRYGFASGNCENSDWDVRMFSEADLESVELQSARNELQNSMLSVSSSMCSSFRQKLATRSRGHLLGSETLALLLSAGAAIGGSEQVAKGLAALAGASTGYGRLIDDGYVNDLVNTQQGIELARRRVFLQINSQQDRNLLEYPLSRAVNDAMRYHAVCNVSDGNSETSRSINEEFSELPVSNSPEPEDDS
ncbi:MAG: hypothetical protein OXI17_12230 [Gammaproteobacteria bacterium]|nr:hypothetical protein [Gammaproteobacteria bacterium]